MKFGDPAAYRKKRGLVKGNFSTLVKIQAAFEHAGIQFIEDDAGGIGVRLQTKTR